MAFTAWHVGDKAIYVAGSPLWREYVGGRVEVIHVGVASDGTRCATIRRESDGDTMKISADERHTNIRPIEETR